MFSLYIGVVILFFADITFVNATVFFPYNSAYGIFAAIAVPLDLGPHRNVFVSYNFEANYNLPYNQQLPAGFEYEDTRRMNTYTNDQKLESIKNSSSIGTIIDSQLPIEPVHTTDEDKESKSRKRRSLLTRRIFYNMLKQKLEMHGYNGEACLLRIICETNASQMGDINGFLGSILHIIFAPSSSKDEGISEIYYKAEFDGQKFKCVNYRKSCSENILDFISTPVSEIMNTLRKKK